MLGKIIQWVYFSLLRPKLVEYAQRTETDLDDQAIIVVDKVIEVLSRNSDLNSVLTQIDLALDQSIKNSKKLS